MQDSRALIVYWSQRNFIHTVCVILSKPDSVNSDEIPTFAAFRLSQQCMKCLDRNNKHLMSYIATALKVQSNIKSAWKKRLHSSSGKCYMFVFFSYLQGMPILRHYQPWSVCNCTSVAVVCTIRPLRIFSINIYLSSTYANSLVTQHWQQLQNVKKQSVNAPDKHR